MSGAQRDVFRLCGTTIDGKYRVLSAVGAGGFGVVYRGVHEGFDAPVAIKCLKLPDELSPEAQQDFVRRLRDEGRLLLQLSRLSPGIVQALDIGAFTTQEGGRVPYLVLEWLDGETLAGHLERLRAGGGGALSRREAILLLDPAARALAVAHEQNIAHRDVKPENLFLAEAGGARTLKVLDFGIAKIIGDQRSRTAALASTAEGPSVFTPRYGAPEQFDKQRGATGPWTDVFALALVFVELVTGARALEGEGIVELYSVVVDPALRPTLRARGVSAPDAIERVLSRALSVSPRDRYPDAGAFWRALIAAEGLEGELPSLPPRSPPAAREAETQVEGANARRSPAPGAEHAGTPAGIGFEPTVPHRTDPASQRPGGAPPAAAEAEPAPRPDHGAASGEAVVVRNAPNERARPGRRGLVALALAASAVAGAAVAVLRRPPEPPPQPSRAPIAAPEPPRPASTNPEAAALYQEALQAYRDGAPDVAARTMERAVALDRGLGAGHLRVAIWTFRQRPAVAREHFQLALLHRAALGERDMALLDAAEPYVRQPSDAVSWERRIEAAVARFPADPELLVYLGAARFAQLRFDAAVEAYDRALALDRGHVLAWGLKGESLGMKGDVAAELAAYQACAETAPGATLCLANRVRLLHRQGDCQQVEEHARRWLSIDPKAAPAHRHLALALHARGAPRESVLVALEQGWAAVPEGERRAKELLDRISLAVLDGDFELAVEHARAWQREVAGRNDQDAHASPALKLAELYREMGLPREAGRVADDFLRRMSAWSEPATTADWTIAFLPYSLRAASMTQEAYDAARSAWVERVQSKWRAAAQEIKPEHRWLLWTEAYAAGVETAADAAAAFETMPLDQPLPSESGRWLLLDLRIGKVYALAGKGQEAIGPLTRVARSCAALADPFSTTEARLYLGMALEATGDLRGAAAAYEAVLERWGKARPRSISAEQARARLAGLRARR
ncbi:protein kinase domain-containing protein [Sorangium sp. So ce693]|uniref:protein kinase domain-containing protein n=1 Tax=Sorangium sp. So ce693 TaxID=3133318 RepID=UPI003F643817